MATFKEYPPRSKLPLFVTRTRMVATPSATGPAVARSRNDVRSGQLIRKSVGRSVRPAASRPATEPHACTPKTGSAADDRTDCWYVRRPPAGSSAPPQSQVRSAPSTPRQVPAEVRSTPCGRRSTKKPFAVVPPSLMTSTSSCPDGRHGSPFRNTRPPRAMIVGSAAPTVTPAAAGAEAGPATAGVARTGRDSTAAARMPDPSRRFMTTPDDCGG
ncbi:hypothetical protein DKT68_30720 [Micromonospora acroterricola]|uniref:Uncharacterized protein n=1 Tax=Micromonospora acroterricola TaxID=2202421 RepID=A0A317CQ89_9ACTN|nr:hypothetical protein DKT68_30720 [Micromonospora acroterricola]